MTSHLLPAWTALEQAYKARSAKALTGVLARAASAQQLQTVERELGTPLPAQLKHWFTLHAATTKPLLCGSSATPMWRMMSPADGLLHWREIAARLAEKDGAEDDDSEPAGGLIASRADATPAWFPFAITESGSVRWFLAVQLHEPQIGAVLFVDFDYLEAPTHQADTLDEIFARELVRLTSGELVVVGFAAGPPQIMARADFARFSDAEGAFLLPRERMVREPPPAIATDEEGRRFITLLVESRLIVLSNPLLVSELASAVGKILRSKSDTKAERLVKLLSNTSGLELSALRPARVNELLTKW